MKKNIYKIFVMAFALFGLVSCGEDYLDDMTGEFSQKAPVAFMINNLTSRNSVKTDAVRLHQLAFGTENNGSLQITFVGNRPAYELSAGTYTFARHEQAAAGNFVDADINGETVVSGSMTVKNDAGSYYFSGLMNTASGKWYRISSEGMDIVFEPDAEPDKYFTGEIMRQDCADAGNNIIPGVYKAGFQIKNEGGEVVAYLEPVKADNATSLLGDYILTEYASAEGQMGNGYVVDLSAWGMGVMKGGSYVVVDGKEVYLNAGGVVSISENGEGAYKVSGVNLSGTDGSGSPADIKEFVIDNIQSLPSLGSAEGDGAVALTWVVSAQSQNNVVTLKLGTPGFTVTAPDYVTIFEEVYSGTGNILSLDLLTSDGKLAPGEFTVVPQADAKVGNAIAGYDTTVDWGWGPMDMFNWGSCWFSVDNALSGKHISEGVVKVDSAASGYVVSFSGKLEDGTPVKASYSGEISF